MKKSTKETITVLILVMVCLFAHNAIGQDIKPKLDTTNGKVWLTDNKGKREVKRDLKGGYLTKSYVMNNDGSKFYFIRREPKIKVIVVNPIAKN